jgi:hypothetical protein
VQCFGKSARPSPERATGAEAERRRLAALSFARTFAMPIHPEGTTCRFNWGRNGIERRD